MHELCVLFGHHRDCAVTRRHLAVLREKNPGVPVVPLACDDGGPLRPVEGAAVVPRSFDRGGAWHNADLILTGWFRGPGRVDAARYVWLEWDCLATAPLRHWYDEVWQADAAAGAVLRTESDPGWWWFRVQGPFLPRAWERHATGLAPLNGVMLSRAALSAVAAEPVVEGVFCELRLGTLLRAAGFTMTPLPPEKARLNTHLPEGRSVPVDPGVAGVYHPVKQ